MNIHIASILFVAYVGYVLGKSDLRVHPVLTAATVVIAVILHGVVRLALPHDRIDAIAALAARSWSPGLVAVGLIETAGIWIPVLAVPWAVLPTRIAGSGYIVGATILGAFDHYRPSFERPLHHPQYEAALLFALWFAAIPFAAGLLTKRWRQRTAPIRSLRT